MQWVHPSWRDLVIGRLQEDAAARREFLSRSGVHGIVLALSTAGGAAGERRLPLLLSDEDWDTLTDRLYTLIPDLEPPELIAALTALGQTLDDLGDREPAGEARALARAVLGRTAALWDASRALIPLLALDAWLSLAGRLDPRPAPPALSVTWVELLPTGTPDLDDRVALERFADWLALCELLWAYHGSGLRGELGFGADQLRLLTEFMYSVDDRRVQAGSPLTASGADLDPILRALSSIASLRPELGGYADHIAYTLRPASPVAAESPPPSKRSTGVETFDVRRVLADL